jgi:hypothetical protein
LGDLGVDGRKYNKIGKVYYFGVNWFSKGILHATTRASLFHWIDPRSLLRNNVFQQGPPVMQVA